MSQLNPTIEISKNDLEKIEFASTIAYETAMCNRKQIDGKLKNTKTKALKLVEVKVNGEEKKITSAEVNGFYTQLNFSGGGEVIITSDYVSIILKKHKKLNHSDKITFINDKG